MEMMRARGISVKAGKTQLLTGVSFTLDAGDWLMVAGQNGAGKTTLLRAIAQIVPYSGEMYIMGQDARALSSRAFARQVAALEQSHAPQTPFTVRQLAQMGRYAHWSAMGGDPQGEDKVREALYVCGMMGMENRSLLTLSGGELQRAFLARVLAQDAPIMLLDEPTGHLDLKYQREIFTLLGEWLKAPGRAVVSVVHDIALVRRYATRVLMLHEGKPMVYAEPALAFSEENQKRVYGMDVSAWFSGLYAPWRGQIGSESL